MIKIDHLCFGLHPTRVLMWRTAERAQTHITDCAHNIITKGNIGRVARDLPVALVHQKQTAAVEAEVGLRVEMRQQLQTKQAKLPFHTAKVNR